MLELLVIVGVIVILVAILLPALSGSKEKARRICCASNLHQIGIRLHGFLAEHHVYPLLRNTGFPLGAPADHDKSWIDALEGKAPYTNGVWHCPSAQFLPQHPAISYGYNSWGSFFGPHWSDLGLGGHTVPILGSSRPLAPPVGESEVVRPDDMMAIGDSFSGGDIFERHFADDEQWNREASRHQGRITTLLCDGHVESPSVTSVFREATDEALARWNRDHQPHREQLP